MNIPVTRIIGHLDMDAFYASVELLRYPQLRGTPVVVGGRSRQLQPLEEPDEDTGQMRLHFARLKDYVGRGVITTATYEARALGVHSAMGLMKAAKLAPDAIILPADFDQYRRYSRLFKAAVRNIAPRVEDRSIDEIYIDLSEVVAQRIEGPEDAWWCAREVAGELKDAVHLATGLTCSVGVAPNKLLAKLGSELDKPNGLTVITAADLPTRIWPLPVRRLNGVGPKASARLQAVGLATIGDLARADPAWLITQFGASYGSWLNRAAHGQDDREISVNHEVKSVSRETTFSRDLHAVRDRPQLSEIFTALCEQLSVDLKRKHVMGRTIAVKLRFDDFKTVTRAQTIARPTDDAGTIRQAAGQCLKRVDLSRKIRLIGVRVDGLNHA